MGERGSVPSGSRNKDGSPLRWLGPVGVVAFVAWVAFSPFVPWWLILLGWAMVLAAANGVRRSLDPQDHADHRRGRISSPGRLAAGLLRLGPESWLLAPHWAKVRMACAGFLMFGAVAGAMAYHAHQEYRLLESLRDRGRRTTATVVGIAGRSEEDSATSLTVRFGTSSGPVRSDVDVTDSSGTRVKPGARIPVVYDPAHPTEVRHVEHLDGREADGIRQGAVACGLLATIFLVGTAWEALNAGRQKAADDKPGPQLPGTTF